jgi:hypothetical protein
LADKLAKVITNKTGHAAKFTQCHWLMSDQLANSFLRYKEEEAKEHHKTVYFINLKDVAKLRTRSSN